MSDLYDCSLALPFSPAKTRNSSFCGSRHNFDRYRDECETIGFAADSINKCSNQEMVAILEVGHHKSYGAIPLEMNAYGLDARFAAAAMTAFPITDEAEAWINAGKF